MGTFVKSNGSRKFYLLVKLLLLIFMSLRVGIPFLCLFFLVPASIQPLDNKIVKKGETFTLFCNASGKPAPSVSWTHVDSGLKHGSKTWVITVNDVSHLGEYRCDASNDYGNETELMTILFEGKCIQC